MRRLRPRAAWSPESLATESSVDTLMKAGKVMSCHTNQHILAYRTNPCDALPSSVLPSVESPIPARCLPATAGEQAAYCLYNGDVDGSVFNALLMMLVVFEGSNHFGSATNNSDSGLKHGDTESNKVRCRV